MPVPARPSNAPVQVGVVGLGFMGVTHLKSYFQLPGARVVAVCDSVRQPVNGVVPGVSGNITGSDALKLPEGTRAYSRLEDLLADPEVELVDLCVPTPLHHPFALAALRAGKHVLCEKPLARTAALAREIVEATRSAKGFFMPAMCLRFWPEWAWVQKAIAANTYGRVLAARFRRVSEPPGWSKGTYLDGAASGGALLDLHIHDADFVQFCFGRPQSVFATGLSHLSGAIDHVVATYRVRNGAAVYAEGSWLMSPGHGFNMCYTVVFEKATADYDLTRGAEALKLFQEGQPPQVIRLNQPDGYVGELQHMIQAIQTGRPPTVVTAEDALSAVEICEAEEKSIQLGQPVTL